MDVTKILEYQALDGEKVKINRELKNSKEATQYMHANEAMKQAIENVAKKSTRAAQLFAKAELLMKQYEDACREFDDLSGEIDGIGDDLKRAEFYEKTLTKLDNIMEQIERETQEALSELTRIEKEGGAEIDTANKNASWAKKYMEDLNKLKQRYAGELDAINAKQKALEESIDPALLNVYRNARKQVKYPPIVKLRDGKLCGACGIELSGAELGKLKDGEAFVNCPTCGRLVYKPEE